MSARLPKIPGNRGRRGAFIPQNESSHSAITDKGSKDDMGSLQSELSLHSTPKSPSPTGPHHPLPRQGSDIEMATEDQLTNEKLQELHSIFEDADEDGGGGLDMEEFRTAMRKAMGDGLTDHELDLIFMKVFEVIVWY